MRRTNPKATAALIVLGLLSAAPAAAQSPNPAPQKGDDSREAEADPRSRQANRILHLRGGRIVRKRSRWTGDHWEVRTGSEWQALPADSVERFSKERDLVKEYKKRERAISKKDAQSDHAERVALAGWLVGEGLYDEAIVQLNRILATAPNHPAALELANAKHIPLAVPRATSGSTEALADLLRFGAQASRVGREFAAAELGRVEQREDLEQTLMGQLVSTSPLRRAFAAHSLRRLFRGEHLRELLGRAILDPSDSVRLEASLALGDAEEPALIVPALRAMGSGHPKVRANAIEALGNMGYAAAVEPLATTLITSTTQRSTGVFPSPGAYIFTGRQTAYIQDFDVEVAQFQAVADPQVNILLEGEVLDVRIQGVTGKTFTTSERSSMRRSLSKLTGEQPGNSTRAWERWWNENKDGWGANTPSDADEGRTAAK